MLYICAKFREIILNGMKVIERTRMINCWRTDRQTDGRTDRQTDGRTDGWTDRQTDTQKFGGYNIIPRHFLWRGIKNFKVPHLHHPPPPLNQPPPPGSKMLMFTSDMRRCAVWSKSLISVCPIILQCTFFSDKIKTDIFSVSPIHNINIWELTLLPNYKQTCG